MRKGETNELQKNANEVQEKLVNIIDKNNKVTSGHNKLMLWLTGVIVFLTIITLFSNYSKTGQYAISGNWENGAIIVDTRTGQTWLRLPRAVYDLGTIDKPKYDKMKRVLGGGLSGTSTIEEMTDN